MGYALTLVEGYWNAIGMAASDHFSEWPEAESDLRRAKYYAACF